MKRDDFVKICVFGDIHGNFKALESLLSASFESNVDKWICLGDLFLKGPEPALVADALMELNRKGMLEVVKGNTDFWITDGFNGVLSETRATLIKPYIQYAQEHLNSKQLSWAKALPIKFKLDYVNTTAIFVHASLNDIEKTILPTSISTTIKEEILGSKSQVYQNTDLIAYSHIHVPLFLKDGGSIVCNPGSIGLPFDNDAKSSYITILFDDLTGEINDVSFKRVEYEIDETIKRAYDENMPNFSEYEIALRTGSRF